MASVKTSEVARLAGRQAIIPVGEIRAGMTGYGLTVFSGTEPERFNVRVIGVLHHFLPKQDIILIKADDARLTHSGIAAGMSGSPIYIEGRLAGALAYGWSFAKDPLAGVTPIENMLAEMRRPRRGRDGASPGRAQGGPQSMALGPATGAEEGAPAPTRRSGLDLAFAEHDRNESLGAWLGRLVPPLSRPTDGRLVRAAVPLSVAGLSAGAVAGLGEALAPYNLVPMAAGGAARPGAKGPDRFTPGGAIAVELIRGDVSAAGTGTVTYTEGNHVLAFGHPMFNIGEAYFPVATAEVLTFMPSLAQSFKMASPIKTIGTLVQDRQSCIVGDTGDRTEMVPVRVTVTGPGRADQVFATEVARHRFLTPMLASSVATSAAQVAAQDVTDAVIQMRSRVGVHGFQPLQRTDFLFSAEGLTPRALMVSSGMKQMQEVLFNPFQPARIDNIDLEVRVDYRAEVAEVIGLSLASDELEPGTRPSLYVTLRPYNGQPYVQAVPFDVPRQLAGQTLKIEVAAGNLARPEIAPPESLRDLVENLRKGYAARELVVTLTTPDEGVVLRGTLVPSLPASVIATLRPGSSTRRADPYKRLSRFTVDMGGVILGKQDLSVRVRDEIP